MATIQAKISRGHKYWYIVESRRVNGKPRPIVLAYLGKAEDLLRRLSGLTESFKIKSFSHGAIAALLKVAHKLDIPNIINSHIKSQRSYMSKKPIRNNLTAGITLLLGAIGRACMPTSKRGWWTWAKTTSCEYLLKTSLCKIDSQHFWDLMDALPADAIEKIELQILYRIFQHYQIETDTLFFDTTNFYTYIATSNHRCKIAQRGKNKQKRQDLRQVGLAMVVSRQDFIPLLHHTYRGNIHDSVIFRNVIRKTKKRMNDLELDLEKHTVVFDRGCNSKANLKTIQRLKLHYVGALTPCHHHQLIEDAEKNFTPTPVNNTVLHLYRDKRLIWDKERTVIVFISQKLKSGQLQGIYQSLKKKKAALKKLQKSLANPRAKKRTKEKLEQKIETLLKGQYMESLITCNLTELDDGKFILTYKTNKKKLIELEEKLGFRILMTDRHDWSSADIIKAFLGQSKVEQAFKNIKNPYHLALTPGFHWTDQKIRVHYFICVLGYQLAAIVWREARSKLGFTGTLDNLLDILNNIRLGIVLEDFGKKGNVKAIHKLEDMSKNEKELMETLELTDFHLKRPKFNGVGVYNS
jgi:transposase